MTASSRERWRVRNPILLASAGAWVLLLANPGSSITHAHAPVAGSAASPVSFQMLLAMNPIPALAASWALMLVAMMSPTLIAPISHVIERSFKRRRFRAAVLFVIGYGAIWMVAGSAILAVQLGSSLIAPQSYLAAAGAGLIALVWQCSPIKQRCLNRSHNHVALAAFGITADRDAVGFGVTHGGWCVASCWALMLFPMLLPRGHGAAMAAVSWLMISERLERPGPLSWRVRGPGKLTRIVVAQTRLRLRALLSGSAPIRESEAGRCEAAGSTP